MKTEKYLIVIAGPTAVGKTALGIDLAEYLNTMVLSADSRQFYKEMSIGTAKPSAEQLTRVKHHFIDNKSISELYGAGHFEKDALSLLNDLFKTHNAVVVVGGSGLYIDALLNGVDDFVEVPFEVRQDLNEQFKEKGMAWLQAEVKQLDPNYYAVADVYNPQRLVRALEVCVYTGKAYSSFLNQPKIERPFSAIKILITSEREKLYANINHRVDEMMQAGLLDEVKSLAAYKHLNALKTVGYKELYAYLDGSYSLETAVDKIKQHTRNYAKRQLTWFKNQDDFERFAPDELHKIKAYLDIIMQEA